MSRKQRASSAFRISSDASASVRAPPATWRPSGSDRLPPEIQPEAGSRSLETERLVEAVGFAPPAARQQLHLVAAGFAGAGHRLLQKSATDAASPVALVD